MVEQGHDVDTDARVDGSAAPVEQAPTGATTLADRLLDGAGTGILALDHQGVVRFPERLRPGPVAGPAGR